MVTQTRLNIMLRVHCLYFLNILLSIYRNVEKQDTHFTYNVTLLRVLVNIVVAEIQKRSLCVVVSYMQLSTI
jgi:hypothetical protein